LARHYHHGSTTHREAALWRAGSDYVLSVCRSVMGRARVAVRRDARPQKKARITKKGLEPGGIASDAPRYGASYETIAQYVFTLLIFTPFAFVLVRWVWPAAAAVASWLCGTGSTGTLVRWLAGSTGTLGWWLAEALTLGVTIAVAYYVVLLFLLPLFLLQCFSPSETMAPYDALKGGLYFILAGIFCVFTVLAVLVWRGLVAPALVSLCGLVPLADELAPPWVLWWQRGAAALAAGVLGAAVRWLVLRP
jgi:hypothetical protein